MSTKEKAGASVSDTAQRGAALTVAGASAGLIGVSAEAMNALEQAAGQGLQNVKREDTALPFLGILQDLSPQVKRTEPAFIEGAQAGMFFESVSKEVFDGQIGLLIVPLLFDKVYNVWKKRINGGGFNGSKKSEAEAKALVAELAAHADMRKRVPTEQLDIVDTALHYVLYQVPATGSWKPALLSCKSTQLKVSRRWNNMMQNLEVPRASGAGVFNPPSWGTMYHITTVVERKDQNSWYNFDLEYNGLITDGDLFKKSQEQYKRLAAGEVKVDFAQDESGEVAQAVGAAEGRPSF